ncbi:hypothetical protein NLI96_g12882 [Meripilus lineatus]|uniref:Uncharacterized protein n=1 Tax=Meripilus lineatus TaxID=2056292 RepID=A0AAD5UNZ9_9APHY|nr:hypothetical protein NLI96_g12882 [Physisporinus lineatus]
MSSLMTLRFTDRIHNPGIITLADRIEDTFAGSSPSPAQPGVTSSAPVGPRALVRNLVLTADKSRAFAAVDSLRLEVHKYEKEVRAKDDAIGALETSLQLVSREICKGLVVQLAGTQEKGHTVELELSSFQQKCNFLSIQLTESQGKEQAASCLSQETQDRLETVEEDLDETYAELAELKITVQNEQAARRTSQELAETEAKQHQYILDVLRAKCSATRNERDKKVKECDKWRQQFADYNARTQEGFKAKDKQISDLRTQLTRKQKELDEAHNDWHIDKEESDWVKKRWEEAREDLQVANNDISALSGKLDLKDAMIADTQQALESLQEEFRAYRQEEEEDARRQREHIETLYKELDESSEEVENCYVEIKDTLVKLDAAEGKADCLCAQVEEKDATIQTLQARMDQADDDLRLAKEAHTSEINTLAGQLAEKDTLLSVARIALDDTKADLEVANTTVSILSADLSDKTAALSEAQVELIETQISLKAAEDKLCAEEAAHQDSVTFADAKTLELSRELVQHDQLIAHLIECEEATLKDIARLEATNKDLNDRILTLEAQLSSTPSAPSSLADPISSVDETSSELEDALAKNAVLEATIKATEVINTDLIRAFGQECNAHDATRNDVQSFQTRLAVASKELQLANEKIESLQCQMESREVDYHALEQKVLEVVAEMNKENTQLGQSKKSIEELLVTKVDHCDRLEKENLRLRGSQSNLATLSNVTNSSVLSPPVRAIQKKTGGSSWFNTGILSPNASFRWSSRASVSSSRVLFVLSISYSSRIPFCPSITILSASRMLCPPSLRAFEKNYVCLRHLRLDFRAVLV